MHDESGRSVAKTNHAVVIAGGGPTGLMLAAELALARVDVAIVERRENQDLVGSRAGGLHARTIEVFDQRGIAERFLSQGQVMQVAGFSFIPLDISDFPIRHNYGLALRQNHIERIMADWVGELPVKFYRGREVTGFTQDDTGVDVELSDGASLRAKYLVGCDGGRSLVRKKAGIDFPGWDASTSYLIAEVETAEEPALGVRRGEKGVNAMRRLEDGKRVGVVLVEPNVGKGDAPTLQELREALIAVYGTDFGVRNPTWLSRFSDMARQAAKYRDRRVLLAGDAAHVHAPAGGQGLNLGVQDAVNLGWKLAQVVKGTSPESLLDTYQAERHPIAARVLRLTMAQTALGRGDDRTEALRENMTELLKMDEPRKRYGAMMSGLDIRYDLGEGHPLLGRRMPDLDLVTETGPRRAFTLLTDIRPVLLNLGKVDGDLGHFDVTPWADRVRRIDARYTGAWELPVLGTVSAPAAVLVRPDGYVAWVGDGTDRGLRDALITWFGPPAARDTLNEQIAKKVGPSKLDIAYECRGNPAHPTVLLIMGLAAQMVNWPVGFLDALVERGLHVVRFDNRDSGHSTHFHDAPPADFAAALKGDVSSASYTLSHMAGDTIGLLDALNLDSAHVVGASMGGAIAQVVAIEHPKRVRSLTSIMATTGEASVGQAHPATMKALFGGPPAKTRDEVIARALRASSVTGSTGFPVDPAQTAERAGLAFDRDHDDVTIVRQAVATVASGDRTEKLRGLDVPTLVVHGLADTLCDPSGGRATAAAIPGAELVLIEGMGHDLPAGVWEQLADHIAAIVQKGEARIASGEGPLVRL